MRYNTEKDPFYDVRASFEKQHDFEKTEAYYYRKAMRDREDQILRDLMISSSSASASDQDLSQTTPTDLIYKPIPDHTDLLDETTAIGKKYKLAKSLMKEQKVFNEKNASKAVKRKAKKDPA